MDIGPKLNQPSLIACILFVKTDPGDQYPVRSLTSMLDEITCPPNFTAMMNLYLAFAAHPDQKPMPCRILVYAPDGSHITTHNLKFAFDAPTPPRHERVLMFGFRVTQEGLYWLVPRLSGDPRGELAHIPLRVRLQVAAESDTVS